MTTPETEKIQELRKLLASTSNPKQKAIYQMVLDAQLKLLEKEVVPLSTETREREREKHPISSSDSDRNSEFSTTSQREIIVCYEQNQKQILDFFPKESLQNQELIPKPVRPKAKPKLRKNFEPNNQDDSVTTSLPDSVTTSLPEVAKTVSETEKQAIAPVLSSPKLQLKTSSDQESEEKDNVNQNEVTEVITEIFSDDVIYQAVGIVECEVYFTENNKAYILIDGNKYQLLYHKPRRKVFKALRKEIESTGNHFQRITVYPRVTHYPYYYQNDEIPDFANISYLQEDGRQKYYYQIRFQLTGFYKERKPRGIFDELSSREFLISGRWQYISICKIPCITIYKNFDEELLKDIKKMNPTRKALFLQSCHIPFRWENPSVKPLKTMGKNKTNNLEETQPFFVKVKARFIPDDNLFEVVEELETPTLQTPRFFKLYQRDKHKSVKYQAQVKAQAMQSLKKNTTSSTETTETTETTIMENLEKSPIKISVIEDDPMMVIAIKTIFEEDSQFSIISTSSTAEAGLTDVKNVQPDVILLDLGLPDASGLDVAREIRNSLSIPIIIFTTSEKYSEVRQAFSIGANGYCVKGCEISQLKAAVTIVREGNIYLDTKIARAVIQELNNFRRSETSSTVSTWVCPSGEVLKEQEIKILQLIADGQSNAEISESLNLSVHTVKSYLKNIMQKMSAKNRAELAAMSVRSGLA